MSEGNVFGQPGKSTSDKITDDLAKTQPDWSVRAMMSVDDRPVKRVPPVKKDEYFEEYDAADEKADAAHDEWVREKEARDVPSFADADPKIGGVQKTPMSGTRDPNLDAKREFHITVQELAEERERLVAERQYLINVLKVDPDDLEPIDGHEALLAMQKAHPMRYATGGIVPPGVPFYEKTPPLGDQRVELDDDVAKATLEALAKREYKWDGNERGKDSNPKDAIGSRKVGLSGIPRQVLYEVALGMLEGALKYARHNYRIAGVRASVYYDANNRHMDAWWEGQDLDPDSQLSHVTKAIASLIVLRDSMLAGNWYDDRPPSIGDPNWMATLNKQAERIIDDFEGEPKQPFIKGDNE